MTQNKLIKDKKQKLVVHEISGMLKIVSFDQINIPVVALRKEITESIRQRGILKPPVLVPAANGKYDVSQGKHRIFSAYHIGFTETECIVDDVQDAVEQDIELLIDNVLRERNYGDEAQAVSRLLETGLSESDICQKLGGVSLTVIKELMRMKRTMSPKVFNAVVEGRAGRAVALKLTRLPRKAQLAVIAGSKGMDRISVKDADAALRVQKTKQFTALDNLVIPSIAPDEETALRVEAIAQRFSGLNRKTLVSAATIIRAGQETP